MSSTRAFTSESNNESYSATKAALLGLTQSMVVSLAPQGIRVNAILPGWINVTNECKISNETGQTWEAGLSKEDHQWASDWSSIKGGGVLKAAEYLSGAEFINFTELSTVRRRSLMVA
ncbi:hypothetical protein LTR17_026388 [Elasticomyces elasticus]|nr:hypothetical protein LTR17_026388 [Elasticomyces elasticus]